MSFQRACALSELGTPGMLAATIEGADGSIAIVRTEDGEVFAIEDNCSHGAVKLSEGEVEGHCVECWLHGARFDLRTGEPTTPPATAAIRVFPVRVEGDDVLVDVDPA